MVPANAMAYGLRPGSLSTRTIRILKNNLPSRRELQGAASCAVELLCGVGTAGKGTTVSSVAQSTTPFCSNAHSNVTPHEPNSTPVAGQTRGATGRGKYYLNGEGDAQLGSQLRGPNALVRE